MLKKYLMSYLYLFGLIMGLTVVITIVSYFFNLNMATFKIIISIISIFIASIILGKKIKKDGYKEGIKFSLLFIFFISICKIIFKVSFCYKTFL